MFIYLVTNTVNNKTYVGLTRKTLEHRFRYHCYTAGYGSQTILHKAIRKYGVESFTVTLLETVNDESLLDDAERRWIAELKPEYNMTSGGGGGDNSAHIDYSNYKWHGEHNPMFGKRGADSPNFGKKRTAESKQRSAESAYAKSRSKPIEINGVTYRSVRHAAQSINRSEKYVRRHGKFSNT